MPLLNRQNFSSESFGSDREESFVKEDKPVVQVRDKAAADAAARMNKEVRLALQQRLLSGVRSVPLYSYR